MSSIYSLAVTQEGDRRQLKFAGDLVINHIDKMTAEVKDALPSPVDTTVVIDNPSNVDMTFIQLLIAIRRATTEAGKTFEVKTTINDDLKDLLAKSGLDKQMGL